MFDLTPDVDVDGPAPEVFVRHRGAVAWIVLNRPARRNAVTPDTMDLLGRHLDALAADATVRAAVLTGAGPAFCAGGDVASLSQGRAAGATAARRARLEQTHATVAALYRFPKPTIAAVHGLALGAGLALALACDLRVVETEASLRPGYAGAGLPGDFGGSWLLSQITGPATARRLYLIDEPIPADQALALGLADVVAGGDEFTAAVHRLAERLASGPTVAYALAKANFAVAATSDLETTMRSEIDHHLRASETEDHRRAIDAFGDRRRPVFEGR
jgi:2-(1,2-epoxy-1,2-dihydrophenyl)acetyl-CoA isomerase